MTGDARPNQLRPNDLVKISRNGERFWVSVMHMHDAEGIYAGRVNNFLLVAPYKFGDKIHFQRDEVLDLLPWENGDHQ